MNTLYFLCGTVYFMFVVSLCVAWANYFENNFTLAYWGMIFIGVIGGMLPFTVALDLGYLK